MSVKNSDPTLTLDHFSSPDTLYDSSKKFEFSSIMVQKNVAAVAAERERNRTTNVNVAFSLLRTCIPTEPKDRKLSKVETLRLASAYISHLATLITARGRGDHDGQVCQRYGYIFRERMDLQGQRYICTFCLAESKRALQVLNSKSMDNSDSNEVPIERIPSSCFQKHRVLFESIGNYRIQS